MKIKTLLGPQKNDINVWGDVLSNKEYDVISTHIQNQFATMPPVGLVTRIPEDPAPAIPAGGAKIFSRKKIILHRENAGALIVDGTFPDAMADLKILKAQLVGKNVGGFAITDVAVASNTQAIL